jgi:hypothetical protein
MLPLITDCELFSTLRENFLPLPAIWGILIVRSADVKQARQKSGKILQIATFFAFQAAVRQGPSNKTLLVMFTSFGTLDKPNAMW